MHLYDVGWRRNLEQVFGVGGTGMGVSTTKRHQHYHWRWWVSRLLWGGTWYVPFFFSHSCTSFNLYVIDSLFYFFLVRVLLLRCGIGGLCSCGTGTQFPHNSRAEDVLAELAAELVRLEESSAAVGV
jgi:hypothetical protein